MESVFLRMGDVPNFLVPVQAAVRRDKSNMTSISISEEASVNLCSVFAGNFITFDFSFKKFASIALSSLYRKLG